MSETQALDETASFEGFRQLLESEGRRPGTIQGYLKDLRLFAEWLDGTGLLEATTSDIRAFVVHSQRLGRKPSTVNRRIAVLRKFYSWLADEEEAIARNPASRIHTLPRRDQTAEIKWLRREEVSRLVAAARTIRDTAMLLVFVSTGLRLRELINLDVTDVRFEPDGCTVLVRRGKGGKSRFVYPSQQATDALLEYLQTRKDDDLALFVGTCGRLSARTVQQIFERCCRRANVNATVHGLRHTFAVHRLKEGANIKEIQQLLGHSSIASTEIYLQLDDSHIAEVARRTEVQY